MLLVPLPLTVSPRAAAQDVDDGNSGPIFVVDVGAVGVGLVGDQLHAGVQHRSCELLFKPSRIPPPGGDWFQLVCDGVTLATVFVPTIPVEQEPARRVAEYAWRWLPIPAPQVRRSPAPVTFVNVSTFLWSDAGSVAPRSVRVTISGMSVSVRAEAVRTTWTVPHTQTRTVCAEPSTAYRPGLRASAHGVCEHVFRRASTGEPGGAFTMQATTTWRLRWWGSDGTSGTLADLDRTTTFTVPVGEVHAVVAQAR